MMAYRKDHPMMTENSTYKIASKVRDEFLTFSFDDVVHEARHLGCDDDAAALWLRDQADAEYLEGLDLDGWIADVTAYSLRVYAYDMTEALDRDDLAKAYEGERSPLAWVEWQAEKYDLQAAHSW